jgi:ERCC4-related helicase
MKITDINLLIMDECHHTDLNHPYNLIMAAYHDVRQQNNQGEMPKLPQIIGLSASLGVGSFQGNPVLHYIRICANLDCSRITHVRKGTENMDELLHFNPRPKRDQIISVQPIKSDHPFIDMITKLMTDVEQKDLNGFKSAFDYGSQQYENWIVGVSCLLLFKV